MSAMFSGKNTSMIVLALVGASVFSVVLAGMGDGGSRCQDASCTPAPIGGCDPRYGEQGDGCCPVWHCPNGATAYGMSKGSSSMSSSSTSFSFNSGGNMPMLPMGNPFSGGASIQFGGGNPFGSLFGGLFGRR